MVNAVAKRVAAEKCAECAVLRPRRFHGVARTVSPAQAVFEHGVTPAALVHQAGEGVAHFMSHHHRKHAAAHVYDRAVGASAIVVSRQYDDVRSEEHTSELQSQSNLVCRLLLEKKKNNKNIKQRV